MSADECYQVFDKSIEDYHKTNSPETSITNPYSAHFDALLYHKNWIDTVQWHLEDLIRNPSINPVEGMNLKRRIDKSNQDRTDIVEQIDDYFVETFKDVQLLPTAKQNSETPAWLLDRMSILMLKIYHMEEQVNRKDVDADHIQRCQAKLSVLVEQKKDMGICFDELMEDFGVGNKKMKVYRQMKMYNDSSLNPVLYGSKNK